MSVTDVRAAVLERVDGLRDELLSTLAEVVRIESITPTYPGQIYDDLVGGESQVSRLLAGIYEEAGAEVEMFGSEPGRENAVGVLAGSGSGRSLILNGHVDVVPAGGEKGWVETEPFSGEVDGERVWGRGTVDMKSGLVAQAFAARALHEGGVRLGGDLVLQAVVGEENLEHQLGTSAAIERGYTADAAIVGEPSGWHEPLQVMPSTPELIVMTIAIAGRASHASMRGSSIRAGGAGEELAVSAIEKGMVVYEALRRLDEDWGLSKRDPLFPPGHFGLHAGTLDAAAENARTGAFIPDYMSMLYGIFHPPGEDPEEVKREILDQIEAVSRTDRWLRKHPPEVGWPLHYPGSHTPPDHPFVKTMVAARETACAGERFAGPARVEGFPSAADATWLRRAGIPTVCFGPGSVPLAHGNDEHCMIDEVLGATRTLALTALEWCG